MGYEARFVPTEEKMQEYKPWNEEKARETLDKESGVNIYLYEILSYCMKERTESPSQIFNQIRFLLRCIFSQIEQDEKTRTYFRWKDEKNHVVWFCGWEFAHDYVEIPDKEDVLNTCAERLMILADIVKTPDYFEQRDNFNTKLDEIKEVVGDFEESALDIVIRTIVSDLQPFKEKEEQEDIQQ